MPLVRRPCRTLHRNIATHKKKRPAFWRFRHTLLNDKYLVDIIKTIIKYYTTLANGGKDIREAWNGMKLEIRLQARRYDYQKQQKNKQYTELEQQIRYLTEKHKLTEAEKQALNRVGTTLKNKFQQAARRRILQNHNLNKHPKSTRLPIYSNKSAHIQQPQL
jgi:hypothetical protein